MKAEQSLSPVSMDISDYRREFAQFNYAFELAHYEHRAGLERELHSERIYDRYSDLFTREAVQNLARAVECVPLHLETERASLHALYGAARIGYLETRARELTDERARCESLARVAWEDASIPVHNVPKKIANESDAARRRELTSRWIDALGTCNDLRAARFDSFHEESRSLGVESYRALCADIKLIDYDQLASAAQKFLERTERAYADALAQWTTHALPGTAMDKLQHADFFYFQRLIGLDAFFPAQELIKTYVSALDGFGIRAETQNNIHIDAEARPFKNPRASCFRINPPDDVRLLVAPIGGAYDYTVFFHEAGHAQHFGWSSRELINRYPEFLYAPDYATCEAHAFLLNNLFQDSVWLGEQRNLRPDIAEMAMRQLSLLMLHNVRRYCAKLIYEIALHDADANGLRSTQMAESYATLQTEATGFARSPELYLWDVDDGFYAADYLRAWAFEVSFREHLRVRYGRRWWASRKAGDELIDLWNTASRYSVEELARLIGLGEISFELLAETLIANVSAS